ncbi:MAG: DNA mismatch repair endonuclease MutL [Bacteroidota bacterium]
MPDIIQLLPDSVANQIAAGEVIQRPASVVKELVENSIDSGADDIKIIIKDAGKTLIQIIDNGCGMSETDARLAFERHATSKIRKAEDLFTIQTMGFRGEALASIAAIAHVELKTKRTEDDLGTFLQIAGSELIGQEAISCSNGSNMFVKNLFFNVPARRKFLKTQGTELRHIIDEFHRLALANPNISFSLNHNDSEIYVLSPGNRRQRVVNIFGKGINHNLVSLETNTSIVKIEGFIGKPEFAKKTGGQQFFFVNNRFMKHPYFYNAVMNAYTNILPPESIPSFFIYFSIDPKHIDINIHPTKTEIKFEDEKYIWQILQATVKESLGKFNIVPSINFDLEHAIEIPLRGNQTVLTQPEIKIDSDYNPFEQEQKSQSGYKGYKFESVRNWEKLYAGKENSENTEFFDDIHRIFQFRNKYIITPVKSGLMFIHINRASERIFYEYFISNSENKSVPTQKLLYPKTIELNHSDSVLLKEKMDEIRLFGFNIDEFGKNTFIINGLPDGINDENIPSLIESILENYKTSNVNAGQSWKENTALILAKTHSNRSEKRMTAEEMKNIIDRLFACKQTSFTQDGKKIIYIFSDEEIEKS